MNSQIFTVNNVKVNMIGVGQLFIGLSAKKHITLFIAFLMISISAFAQTNFDSLISVWQNEQLNDSLRIEARTKYIWERYLYTNQDSAKILGKELEEFAQNKNQIDGVMSGLNFQAIANAMQGEHRASLEINKQILSMAKEYGDRERYSSTMGNMGISYKQLGDLPKALECYQHSLAYGESVNDSINIVNSLTNIGALYRSLGDYPQALDHYQRSLAMLEKLDLPRAQFTAQTNLGNLFIDWKRFDEALEILEKSLATSEKNGDLRGSSKVHMNIGNLYVEQGKLALALKYQQKSVELFEKINDQFGLAKSNKVIGDIYLLQGQPKIAIPYCLKGLEIAHKMGSLAEEHRSCDCLYKAYKEIGNDKMALKYFEQKAELSDSLFNAETTRKLTRLEMQYDFDKKEEMARAEQEKKDAIAAEELHRQKIMRNGFMSGFLLVVLFAGFALFQRNRIRKEKDRSEELLLNILPEEVAEELKIKGEAEAVHLDQVTVIFTDFKGFTDMSEQLSPRELVKDLHECFSAFDNICEKHGLEKIKTIGDAYMAAGGLPTPNTTHAVDVVKAALEIREFVESGKTKKLEKGLPYFEIRIGVHTGPVVAGIVGVKKFQYDIWGDTVNTASRMESSSEVGKVNISQSTYDLLKNDPQFAFESRGKIKAKGKGEIEMYFVSKA